MFSGIWLSSVSIAKCVNSQYFLSLSSCFSSLVFIVWQIWCSPIFKLWFCFLGKCRPLEKVFAVYILKRFPLIRSHRKTFALFCIDLAQGERRRSSLTRVHTDTHYFQHHLLKRWLCVLQCTEFFVYIVAKKLRGCRRLFLSPLFYSMDVHVSTMLFVFLWLCSI